MSKPATTSSEQREEYEAELFKVGGKLLALWDGTLYEATKRLEHGESAGKVADRHDGLVLQDGTVYTVSRESFQNNMQLANRAEFWLGVREVQDSWTKQVMNVAPYWGTQSAVGCHLLEPIEKFDTESEVSCNVCSRTMSFSRNGANYEQQMIDHIRDRHTQDGELTEKTLKGMYEKQ